LARPSTVEPTMRSSTCVQRKRSCDHRVVTLRRVTRGFTSVTPRQSGRATFGIVGCPVRREAAASLEHCSHSAVVTSRHVASRDVASRHVTPPGQRAIHRPRQTTRSEPCYGGRIQPLMWFATVRQSIDADSRQAVPILRVFGHRFCFMFLGFGSGSGVAV